MKIVYNYNKPTFEQYKFLRDSVGWNLKERGIDNSRAESSLKASPLCVSAFDGEKIIGMVRLSGDLDMYGYIQDTIVLPNYQGRKIGRKLMDMLLVKISDKKGYLLGVCPSKVSVHFYESFGFKKRPENPNGFMSKEF